MRHFLAGSMVAIAVVVSISGCGKPNKSTGNVTVREITTSGSDMHMDGSDNTNSEKIIIDPFDESDNIEITIGGVEPYGFVHVTNWNDPEIEYEFSKNHDLSNGDQVTIYAKFANNNSKYELSETEKTVTVENLPSYIYSLEEIPDASWEQLKKAAQEKIERECRNPSNGDWEYVGSCLLVKGPDVIEDEGNANLYNELNMAYKLLDNSDGEDDTYVEVTISNIAVDDIPENVSYTYINIPGTYSTLSAIEDNGLTEIGYIMTSNINE